MYRKEKKIPTILALFLILTGVGFAYLLDKTSTSYISKAGNYAIPKDVRFTNVSDSSFTVSWVTGEAVLGSIVLENNGQSSSFLDDLDTDNVPKKRSTHYVTARGLRENTSYTVKLVSGNQDCADNSPCPTYNQQTANKLDSPIIIPPAHGSLFSDSAPAESGIVYLTVGKSAPLSGRVDSSGLWVIPLSNLRTQEFTSRPEISDNDIVQITAQLTASDVATAVVDVGSIRQNLTIPKMQLGNSYNFIDLLSKKDYLAKTETDLRENILGTETKKTELDILFPRNDGDTTTDKKPRLRGTGPSGSTLLITVNSTPQTGKVTVGIDGTWTWRPPEEISPGIHNLSVTGYDINGNLITLTRKFIVLKSGEAVLGEATPSASLTPQPTATPSPTVNLTPTISPAVSLTITSTPFPTTTSVPTTTAIPTRPPTSGQGGLTLILIGLGLAFIASSKLIPFLP